MNSFASKVTKYISGISVDELRSIRYIYWRFRYTFVSHARWFFISPINRRLLRGKTKYFCIGQNKTGTTSIGNSFRNLRIPVGDQRRAEILFGKYYFEGNFDKIISYCHTAQAFQDLPFSAPGTYLHLDKAFEGSKFILTIRDNPDQWYRSLIRSHSNLFGKNGNLPTVGDLKNATYIKKGDMYNVIKLYGTSDEDPYNKEIMTEYYERHNLSIIEYFKDRPNDLLILNLADEGSYQKFIHFLGIKSPLNDFPWDNRS